jgi:hypothetical protein
MRTGFSIDCFRAKSKNKHDFVFEIKLTIFLGNGKSDKMATEKIELFEHFRISKLD